MQAVGAGSSHCGAFPGVRAPEQASGRFQTTWLLPGPPGCPCSRPVAPSDVLYTPGRPGRGTGAAALVLSCPGANLSWRSPCCVTQFSKSSSSLSTESPAGAPHGQIVLSL